jgi:ATP/maltotriose-dependent transcriptional regulator MalT
MQRGVERFDALGNPLLKGGAMALLGWMELMAGNPSSARSVLLEADSILAASNNPTQRSTYQAVLALAYVQLGHHDAARAAIELAERLGGPEDLATVIDTQWARARLALSEGDLAEAELQARRATEDASRVDFIVELGLTKLELAEVLAAAERPDEAATESREALALFEEKGDQPNAAKARRMVDHLETH